jgi:hypothetical protein
LLCVKQITFIPHADTQHHGAQVINLNNVSDIGHWINQANHTYIGRYCKKIPFHSIWHNPFKVNDYGRERALVLFSDYLHQNSHLVNNILDLESKILGCWCKPAPCHGDVLVEYLDYVINVIGSDN